MNLDMSSNTTVFCHIIHSLCNQNTPVKSAAVPPARDKVDAWQQTWMKKTLSFCYKTTSPCLKFADLQALGNDVAFIACS